MSRLNLKLLSEIRRLVRSRASAVREYARTAERAQALVTQLEKQGFQVSRSQTCGPNGILWTAKVSAGHTELSRAAIGIRANECEAIQVAAEKAGARVRS